jgi:hypothetical protein
VKARHVAVRSRTSSHPEARASGRVGDLRASRDRVVTIGHRQTYLAIGLVIRACQGGRRVQFVTAAQWPTASPVPTHVGALQAEALIASRPRRTLPNPYRRS